MDKIRDIINKYEIIDIIFIILVMILVSCFVSNHFLFIFQDRGREFLIPYEILKGNVPYKDITLIYFPTSYYINALVYKFLGVSVNSLIISQTFICTLFSLIFYYCSRFFIDRIKSVLITLIVIFSCIFPHNDLFSFIMPYSYARAFGAIWFIICTFLILKLFKTEKIIYAYLSALTAGFCFSCKLEYFTVYVLLLAGMLMYKRLQINQYVKICLLSLIFPVLMLLTLLIQGVSFSDLLSAINFSIDFSKTSAMIQFLTNNGMYPIDITKKIKLIALNIPYLLIVIALCFTALKLNTKYKKTWIFPCSLLLIWRYYFDSYTIQQYWLALPIFVLTLFFIKYKQIIQYKETSILLISGLLCSQREFFNLSLTLYGTYAFPLLFLSLCVIVKNYVPKEVLKVNVDSLVTIVLVVLLGFYSYCTYDKRLLTPFPVKTSMGTFYTDIKQYDILLPTLYYIEKNINKNASILVLPEGNIINFVTGRKNNMKCFMMDRLYHDAYGNEKAKDMIENTKSDYIILIKGLKSNDFYSPYLYDKNASLSSKYINKNYISIKNIKNALGDITIMKKK